MRLWRRRRKPLRGLSCCALIPLLGSIAVPVRTAAGNCVRYDRAIHVQDFFVTRSPGALAATESLACVGTPESLLVLQRTSPSQTRIVSRTRINATRIAAMSPTRALVGDLRLVDLTDPHMPRDDGLVQVSLPDESPLRQSAFLRGDQLAVIQSRSLEVYDLVTPQALTLIASLPLPADVTSSAGDSLLCAVGTDHQLRILDWSAGSGASPAILGTLPVQGEVAAMKGEFAYLVAPVTATRTRLQIVDARDPAQPRIAGAVEFEGAPGPIAIAGTRALARGTAAVRILDIADPDAPRDLGTMFTVGNLRVVQAMGTTALVSAYSSVFTLDASLRVPPHPMSSSTWMEGPGVLDTSGGVVAIANQVCHPWGCAYTTLVRVDKYAVDDPFHPRLVEACVGAMFGQWGASAVLGSTVSVPGSSWVCWGDWTDPFGGYDLVQLRSGLGCTNGRVFQVGESISGPVFEIPLPDVAWGADVRDGMVFVGCSAAGLQVLDATSLAEPTIVASLQLPYPVTWVDVEGAYAYLTDTGPGLQIVDITTPTAPRALGRCWLPEEGRLASDGITAYVACPRTGVVAVDVTDPLAPHVVQNFGPGAGDVGVLDGLVVSTREHAFDIFFARCATTTAVAIQDFTGSAVNDGIELRWFGDGQFQLYRAAARRPRTEAVRLGEAENDGPSGWRYMDRNVEASMSYSYWVTATDESGGVLELDPIQVTAKPQQLTIHQVGAGARADHVTFECRLPRSTAVQLDCFDIRGRRVRRLVTGPLAAGRHELTWDVRDDRGTPVAAGIYLVRLQAGSKLASTRAVLIPR